MTENDTTFRIVYPLSGALVYWKHLVIINNPDLEDNKQFLYVLAHDGLWHKQQKIHQAGGRYVCRAVFGFEENRSGWGYSLIAVVSPIDMPETIESSVPQDGSGLDFGSLIVTPIITVIRR